MKTLNLIPFLLLALLLTSCESLIDEVLYGHYEANCKVVEQSSIRKITEGKAVMDVKVKNKGQLDACNLTVIASLEMEGLVIEKQCIDVGHLSSKASKTVTVTFYKIIYGSEYDSVNISLWYDEVEREDYDDDNW